MKLDLVLYFQPKSHVIIESDPEHFLKASKWADGQSNVSVFQDSWEEVLPNLDYFDVIFYQSKVDNPQELGGTLLDQSQELISSVHAQIPQLKTIRYSDEDIDSFYQQVGHLHPEQTAQFLLELKENQQITEQQYRKFIEKYNFEVPQKTIVKMVDPIFHFFEACREKHMKSGSSLIVASSDFISKYENPDFYQILSCYLKKTGLPTLINTSFNMNEEPIVCTPNDAIRSIIEGNLPYLAIENFLVENPQGLSF